MTEGEQLRNEGIERVLRSTPAGWQAEYTRLAAAFFAALPVGGVFTGEELRGNALIHGLPEPEEPNAWGGMAMSYLSALRRLHMIEVVGVAKAKSARSHAHQYRTYEKLR